MKLLAWMTHVSYPKVKFNDKAEYHVKIRCLYWIFQYFVQFKYKDEHQAFFFYVTGKNT